MTTCCVGGYFNLCSFLSSRSTGEYKMPWPVVGMCHKRFWWDPDLWWVWLHLRWAFWYVRVRDLSTSGGALECRLRVSVLLSDRLLEAHLFSQSGITPRGSWKMLYTRKKCSYKIWCHYLPTFLFLVHEDDLFLSCSEAGADPSHDDNSRHLVRIGISLPGPGTGLCEVPSRRAAYQATHLPGVWDFVAPCRYFPTVSIL